MLEITKQCDGCGRALDGEGLPIPMFPVQHCCSLECIATAIAKADPSFPATATNAAVKAMARADAKAAAIAATAATRVKVEHDAAAASAMFAAQAQAQIDDAAAKVGKVVVK
jgi:hypothetical protein